MRACSEGRAPTKVRRARSPSIVPLFLSFFHFANTHCVFYRKTAHQRACNDVVASHTPNIRYELFLFSPLFVFNVVVFYRKIANEKAHDDVVTSITPNLKYAGHD